MPPETLSDLGVISLLPVALALVLSIASRNVILGLFIGLFTGVLLVEGFSPIAALTLMVRDYLVPQVTDSYNAGVLVLLAFIGGFVALMEKSGGGAAFAARVMRFITTRARLQVAAWLGGILIFFSDLGTPLIIGPTFRPLADSLRVSRAKLAYIIDSTASPVAILVPFIGWGVYIMGLLNQQIESLGVDASDYALLLSALPFQLYAWLALAAVPLLAIVGIEFGPMRRAEDAARAGNPSATTERLCARTSNARQCSAFVCLAAVGGVRRHAFLGAGAARMSVRPSERVGFSGRAGNRLSSRCTHACRTDGVESRSIAAAQSAGLFGWHEPHDADRYHAAARVGDGRHDDDTRRRRFRRDARARERRCLDTAAANLRSFVRDLICYRFVVGHLRYYVAACHACCICNRCTACGVCGRWAFGRTIRRPLLADLRDNNTLVCRRRRRCLRSLSNSATLCARQRRALRRGLYYCWVKRQRHRVACTAVDSDYRHACVQKAVHCKVINCRHVSIGDRMSCALN